MTYVQRWRDVNVGRISIQSSWNTKNVGITMNVPAKSQRLACKLTQVLLRYGSRLYVQQMKSETGASWSPVSISTISKWDVNRYVLFLRGNWNKTFLRRYWVVGWGVHRINGYMTSSSISEFNTWKPIVDVVTRLMKSLVRILLYLLILSHPQLSILLVSSPLIYAKYSKNRSFPWVGYPVLD